MGNVGDKKITRQSIEEAMAECGQAAAASFEAEKAETIARGKMSLQLESMRPAITKLLRELAQSDEWTFNGTLPGCFTLWSENREHIDSVTAALSVGKIVASSKSETQSPPHSIRGSFDYCAIVDPSQPGFLDNLVNAVTQKRVGFGKVPSGGVHVANEIKRDVERELWAGIDQGKGQGPSS